MDMTEVRLYFLLDLSGMYAVIYLFELKRKKTWLDTMT